MHGFGTVLRCTKSAARFRSYFQFVLSPRQDFGAIFAFHIFQGKVSELCSRYTLSETRFWSCFCVALCRRNGFGAIMRVALSPMQDFGAIFVLQLVRGKVSQQLSRCIQSEEWFRSYFRRHLNVRGKDLELYSLMVPQNCNNLKQRFFVTKLGQLSLKLS